MAFIETVARQVFGKPRACGLRTGFWFDLMQPGQATTRHTHDNDELLSAVYYVTVPPASGDLILYSANARPPRITLQEGRLVLFPSALPHKVAENRGAKPRLSIGMNIGPA